MSGDARRPGAGLFLAVGNAALLVVLWQGWPTIRFVQRPSTATGHVGGAAHPLSESSMPAGAVVRFCRNSLDARPIGTPVSLKIKAADLAGPTPPSDSSRCGSPLSG